MRNTIGVEQFRLTEHHCLAPPQCSLRGRVGGMTRLKILPVHTREPYTTLWTETENSVDLIFLLAKNWRNCSTLIVLRTAYTTLRPTRLLLLYGAHLERLSSIDSVSS
jgi:hypothetical protein